MRVDKKIVALGLFNILGYLFTEMALMSNWLGSLSSFNTLSAFGIVVIVLNSLGLYHSIKVNKSFGIKITIIVMIAYGFYQLISIMAVSYRFVLLLAGALLCGMNNKS